MRAQVAADARRRLGVSSPARRTRDCSWALTPLLVYDQVGVRDRVHRQAVHRRAAARRRLGLRRPDDHDVDLHRACPTRATSTSAGSADLVADVAARGTSRTSNCGPSQNGSSVGKAPGSSSATLYCPSGSIAISKVRWSANTVPVSTPRATVSTACAPYSSLTHPDQLVRSRAVELLARHRRLHIVEQLQPQRRGVEGGRVDARLAHTARGHVAPSWPPRTPAVEEEGPGRSVRRLARGQTRRTGRGRASGGRCVVSWRADVCKMGSTRCPPSVHRAIHRVALLFSTTWERFSAVASCAVVEKAT